MIEELFTIKNKNYEIRGVKHIPKDTIKAVIIYCYGLAGDRVDCHRLAVNAGRFFSKNKYAFVRFDARGTATSDGESIEFTYCDLISDLEKVINYAQVYFGNQKIVLLGVSEGAILASHMFTKYKSRLVLWSPILYLDNSGENKQQIMDGPKLNKQGLLSNYSVMNNNQQKRGNPYFGIWINSRYFIERNMVSYKIEIEKLSDSLCIYGTKDERVVHTVNELKKIGSSIYSIENADHVYSHTLYMDKLFMQTNEWLEGRDK